MASQKKSGLFLGGGGLILTLHIFLLSLCCDQTPNKKQLKGERRGCVLARGFRGSSQSRLRRAGGSSIAVGTCGSGVYSSQGQPPSDPFLPTRHVRFWQGADEATCIPAATSLIYAMKEMQPVYESVAREWTSQMSRFREIGRHSIHFC